MVDKKDSEKFRNLETKEEAEIWMKDSLDDLDTAEYNLNGDKIKAGIFYSQQAAEKSLKALYIKKYKKLLKVHDLVLLARKLDAPESIIINCSKINPAYTDSRYPDLIGKYSLEEANIILDLSKEVVEWIKKIL